MHVVDNKFEIGEVCYTVYRSPIDYKCPVCEGDGTFLHNGYDVWCRNCSGFGKLHNPKQYVMDICRVRVRRIIASIWSGHITVKYKVDIVDDLLINVNKRSEATLFKTAEEAAAYCEAVNTKQITP